MQDEKEWPIRLSYKKYDFKGELSHHKKIAQVHNVVNENYGKD